MPAGKKGYFHEGIFYLNQDAISCLLNTLFETLWYSIFKYSTFPHVFDRVVFRHKNILDQQ